MWKRNFPRKIILKKKKNITKVVVVRCEGLAGVRKWSGRTTLPMVLRAAETGNASRDAVTIATGEAAAMGQDYYAALELGRGATDADIKKA